MLGGQDLNASSDQGATEALQPGPGFISEQDLKDWNEQQSEQGLGGSPHAHRQNPPSGSGLVFGRGVCLRAG